MNADKAKLCLGTRQQLNKLSVREQATAAGRQSQLLWVRLEPRRHHRQPVKHIDHVTSLCQACFFQLRQLRQVGSPNSRTPAMPQAWHK